MNSGPHHHGDTETGGYVLSGSQDKTARLWDVATGERLYTMSEPLDGLNTIAVVLLAANIVRSRSGLRHLPVHFVPTTRPRRRLSILQSNF